MDGGKTKEPAPKGGRVADVGLLVLFVALDLTRMAGWSSVPGNFGYDAALYRMASEVWLSGGNPWGFTLMGAQFVAPPTTLLVGVPFIPLGDLWVRVAWMTIAFGSSLYAVRKVGLPLWWVAFPPLWISVMAGNPSAFILAALLRGWGPLAAFTKAYCIIPLVLLGRWRETLVTAGLVLVTAPLLPWGQYAAMSATVTTNLTDLGAALSAWKIWPLWIATAVAILVLRKRGAWLAVPAMWPESLIHHATLGLPAVSRPVGMLLALQVPLAPVLAVAVAGLEELLGRVSHDPQGVRGGVGVRARVPDHAQAGGAVAGQADRVHVVLGRSAGDG